jgi:hypothetical protein
VVLPLQRGGEITRRELAQLIGYADETALQRGMVKPQVGPFTNDLFLFHDPEENPYGDIVTPDSIEYVGQGKKGDQRLSAQNLYLAEHLRRGLRVHFLVKQAPGRFAYEGEVICQDYQREFRPEEERSVLRFHLVRQTPEAEAAEEALTVYERDRMRILDAPAEPTLMDRLSALSKVRRVIRDTAFRDLVLEAYKRICAVCGPPLNRGPYWDLQAAHIVAVTERGPDHRRNGISLCHRHHWAFDHGIFALTDDLRIRNLTGREDPHGELVDGGTILVPSDPSQSPYPSFLAMHRSKWAEV